MPIKISIAGTHERLMARLRAEPDLIFFRRYFSGEEAVRNIPAERPDLLLVDFCLPCMDGFECVKKLKVLLPALPVLMFTTGLENNLDLIFSALYAGANGYLPKDLPSGESACAIEQTHTEVRCRRRIFLMFFDSDVQLGKMARHWEKIASGVKAQSATIHYGPDWRRVVLTGRAVKKGNSVHGLRLPDAGKDRMQKNSASDRAGRGGPIKVSDRALVAV